MKQLKPEWLDRAYEYHFDDWLWHEWGHARGWMPRLPQMLLWYATAGSWGGRDAMADTMVRRVKLGQLKRLPARRRRTLEDAKALAEEVCGRRATNPVEWFTGGCGNLESGWCRLQRVHGVGPKVASFFLRDLSFLRDYSDGGGGAGVTYRERRTRRWFESLGPRDQALFLPIDVWVHAGAGEHRASPIIAAKDAPSIQADPALHRRAAAELARWARRRGLDPRDLDMYWYEVGAGNIHEDGCECTWSAE